jgi:epoxyqueuosine reductase
MQRIGRLFRDPESHLTTGRSILECLTHGRKTGVQQLANALQEFATGGGADFLGIADLLPVRDAFSTPWPLSLKGPTCGISIGVPLDHWIVDNLSPSPEVHYAKLCWHHCYAVVNQQLDWTVLRMAAMIQKEGFRAVPVPVTVKIDEQELLGPFTHKAVARLAGLGWIGKSCLLVTPQTGPRVRWATVLTNAPLTPTGKLLDQRCGSCQCCVKACPVNAFTGREFRQDEPIELRYDVKKCQTYLKHAQVCGLCLASCPIGKPPEGLKK